MKPGISTDRYGKLLSARFAFNGMNSFLDPADIDIESGVCVDIKNCDVDHTQNVQRRKGYTNVVSGNITSAWANSTSAYCVINGKIYSFDGTNTTLVTNSPTSLMGRVEFKQVNNIVVFSDGITIGVIDGTSCTVISSPPNWSDVTSVGSWVATHFPNNPKDYDSNFSVDTFKLATLSGTCLEYFNGVLYMAIGNFVYCTKAFDIEHMDIRRNVVAGFPDDITMIARVNDGLYVGTKSATYFLSGTGYEDENFTRSFTQIQVCKYGVVKGSNVRINSSLVPALESKDTCVIWTSPSGIIAGGNGGRYINLSEKQLTLKVGLDSCAYFKEIKGLYQYLVCFNTSQASVEDPSLQIDTLTINTISNSHSRYTNYAFNSFFSYNGNLYGTNSRGIYKLIGEKDYEGESSYEAYIDAECVLPSTDFLNPQLKSVKDAFVHGRFDGDMSIDIIVDEEEPKEGFILRYDGIEGIHRKRCKLPFGIKSTNWQFKIKNIDGCSFSIFEFAVLVRALQRII